MFLNYSRCAADFDCTLYELERSLILVIFCGHSSFFGYGSFLLFSESPDRLWSPPILLSNWKSGISTRSVELTTCFYPVSILRILNFHILRFPVCLCGLMLIHSGRFTLTLVQAPFVKIPVLVLVYLVSNYLLISQIRLNCRCFSSLELSTMYYQLGAGRRDWGNSSLQRPNTMRTPVHGWRQLPVCRLPRPLGHWIGCRLLRVHCSCIHCCSRCSSFQK